ncbi:MAG: hypothetical protein R3B45_00870 [Bdellovibrionota bacterium]
MLEQQDPNIYSNIEAMLDGLKSMDALDLEEINTYLDTFEKYECWHPFFHLMKHKISQAQSDPTEDYIRMARAQGFYLEDIESASKTCCELVEQTEIGFSRFLQEIIPQIIEKDNYIFEAMIFEMIGSRFKAVEDHVSCLERLCMLYEKKIYDESRLAASYERLLQVDPKNIKALRYFKLVYTQNQDWESVAESLQELMKSVSRKQEKFRVAQELAAVLLYQLDQPKDSIEVLKTCCKDSPLSSTTIEFDAYYRMRDWQSCLDILLDKLQEETFDEARAMCLFNIAKLYLQLKDSKLALEYFEKSADTKDEFLDPIEQIINIKLEQNDWKGIVFWLEELKKKSTDGAHIERIEQAVQRIDGGIKDDSNQL